MEPKRTRAAGRSAVGLGATAALLVVAIASCRDPTEVTLEITTDQPCGVLDGVAITTGTLDSVGAQAAATVTRTCTTTAAGGSFGTLVLTPSGAKDERFAVQITGSIVVPVETCSSGTAVGPHAPGTGCIVARRAMPFLPHTRLYLPIELRKGCLDVTCKPDETCNDGACVTATIPDPSQCTTPTACAVTADGGSVVDATTDAPASDALADGPSRTDATDGAVADATPCGAGPGPGPGCHTATPGASCSLPSGGSLGPCAPNIEVCCATNASLTCRTACETVQQLEYSFACDEAQDCAAGEYCIASAVAGPGVGAGAQCQPPAGACSGARLCKLDCDCGADEICESVTCPVALGGQTIVVAMRTCGSLCP